MSIKYFQFIFVKVGLCYGLLTTIICKAMKSYINNNNMSTIQSILRKIDLGIDTSNDLDLLFELRTAKTVDTFGKLVNSKDRRRTSKSNVILK